MKKYAAFLLGLFIFSSVSGECRDWKEYKRRYFIIYHNDAPQDFIKEVDKAAEEYYREIARNLGFTRYDAWTWDDRARIYIYDDSEDYVQSSKLAQWSHGAASPEDNIIRTFPSAHGFFDSTLPHEIGHIIFREFIGFRARVPAWFEEGVAMYQEKAKRWGADEHVKEALDNGRFISIMDLTALRLTTRTGQDIVNLFYAESASIVNFLISEYGKTKFVHFCRKLKEGASFEKALAKVYVNIKDLERLNTKWVEYVKTK